MQTVRKNGKNLVPLEEGRRGYHTQTHKGCFMEK